MLSDKALEVLSQQFLPAMSIRLPIIIVHCSHHTVGKLESRPIPLGHQIKSNGSHHRAAHSHRTRHTQLLVGFEIGYRGVKSTASSLTKVFIKPPTSHRFKMKSRVR